MRGSAAHLLAGDFDRDGAGDLVVNDADGSYGLEHRNGVFYVSWGL